MQISFVSSKNPDLEQPDLLVQKPMRKVGLPSSQSEIVSVSSFDNPSSELSTTSDSEERNVKCTNFDEHQNANFAILIV